MLIGDWWRLGWQRMNDESERIEGSGGEPVGRMTRGWGDGETRGQMATARPNFW